MRLTFSRSRRRQVHSWRLLAAYQMIFFFLLLSVFLWQDAKTFIRCNIRPPANETFFFFLIPSQILSSGFSDLHEKVWLCFFWNESKGLFFIFSLNIFPKVFQDFCWCFIGEWLTGTGVHFSQEVIAASVWTLSQSKRLSRRISFITCHAFMLWVSLILLDGGQRKCPECSHLMCIFSSRDSDGNIVWQ